MFPEQIDRYQVQSEIARGGMAIIYLAYDPQHSRDVAIKVLPREYLYDPKFRARFHREIDIMISIQYPGIVPIYGYGQYQGQLYLVMRYMAGGSLEEYIEQRGKLTLSETASLVEKIAPILESAHAQGIIHRDLKPSNILFDEDEQPFISDFGIARLSEQSNIAALTGSALLGSPAYMSPEQGRIGVKLDGRSDVYSLGVMVFEMLTGKLPYDAENPVQLVLKHIREPVPDILAINPQLPPMCRQIIQTAMAKDPEQRYPNAMRLASALQAAAQAEKIPALAPAGQIPIQKIAVAQEQPAKSSPIPGGKVKLPGGNHLPQASSLPAPLYAIIRPFNKYLQIPSILRKPAVGYITIPDSLRRSLSFLHLPASISLPKNKLWWLIGIILLIFILMGFCSGLLAIRAVVLQFHAAALFTLYI